MNLRHGESEIKCVSGEGPSQCEVRCLINRNAMDIVFQFAKNKRRQRWSSGRGLVLNPLISKQRNWHGVFVCLFRRYLTRGLIWHLSVFFRKSQWLPYSIVCYIRELLVALFYCLWYDVWILKTAIKRRIYVEVWSLERCHHKQAHQPPIQIQPFT